MPQKYRIGVIGRTGHGDYGHGLDAVWQLLPETEIVAVADDDKMGLAAAAKRLNVDRAYSDYRRMLEDAKPDIVAICQRWVGRHHEMAVAAADRGIHIFMEKPFCRSLEEADDIVAACERTHARLVIAHPTRYSPLLQAIKSIIDDGRLGQILEYRGRGKEDNRGGGEDLWVLGTHVMDMVRTIGGSPQWCFGHVTAEGRPVTKNDVHDGNEGIGPLAGDGIRALYGMPDGSTFSFQSFRRAAGSPSRYGLQIYGSRGILELVEGVLPEVHFLADPSWSPGRSGKSWQKVSSAGIGKPEPLSGRDFTERHLLAVKDLLAAIEEERQPAGNMYEARGTVEMIAAVFESHRLAAPVTFPLANRKNPLTMLAERHTLASS